jgi:hypothetical protein
MAELKNAGVDVTPEVSLFASALLYSLFRHPFLFPAYPGWNDFAHHPPCSLGNSELAEHDGFHWGPWTGRGRCWGEEEVKRNHGSCRAVHWIKMKGQVDIEERRAGDKSTNRRKIKRLSSQGSEAIPYYASSKRKWTIWSEVGTGPHDK